MKNLTAPPVPLLIETHTPSEAVGPGVKKQWVYKSRILLVEIDNMSPAAVEAWKKTLLESRQGWNLAKPYLVLSVHHNAAKMALSPMVREAAKEIAASTPPNLYGRTAVVLEGNHLLVQLVNLFMRRELGHPHPDPKTGMERRVFGRREEALRWLSELLPDAALG